jgi:hypothetical protein
MVIDDPPEIWVFALYKFAASYWRRGGRNQLLEQLIHHNVIYLTCGIGELLPDCPVAEKYAGNFSN